jgi:putative DNA methylase
MTRMIERWFPCAEVSETSRSGWGSGRTEKALFTWFAARPLAQARAAVLTSLLPWPDDEAKQKKLKKLVLKAMSSPDGAAADVAAELQAAYPDGYAVLDPFCGRGLIPLEGARFGARALGIDYSPVATLAGKLLADYPLRDWSAEPELPFADYTADGLLGARLLIDVTAVLAEIGRRFEQSMAEFYPQVDGKQPWSYLWATTLPCQECGRRFPLTGSLLLRHPSPRRDDPGQSYRIEADRDTGTFRAVVHTGPPSSHPTLSATMRGGKKLLGKSAICPFCDHVHPKDVHARLAAEGLGRDELLIVGDLDDAVGKCFREPTEDEVKATRRAVDALGLERDFGPGVPAVPDEQIPVGNGDTIRGSLYGAQTYGDLCNPRQTLGFVRLSRIIAEIGPELVKSHRLSRDYAAALTGYAGAVLVRKLKRSTRGTTLDILSASKSSYVGVTHIFANEASVSFSYDYVETGLGQGSGTWYSTVRETTRVLRDLLASTTGRAAAIDRGSAVHLPVRPASLTAVVTDPPYDDMIDYSDLSDVFYVWLKRAMRTTHPWLAFTGHPHGLQEKAEEIIVKRFFAKRTATDHRTTTFYDDMIARAFTEAGKAVVDDGVVTIVFGHGDLEVLHRFLRAVSEAGLVLTGSWPAKTEAGGSASSANIVTTLTMACRPAPLDRQVGRAGIVEAEVRQAIKQRVPMWEAAGLAIPDQLMAAVGPAMEMVGRYSEVLDNLGNPVKPYRYLLLARKAVQEAAAIEIDDIPLESFDARSRFALFWARMHGKSQQPKSEARWQALASDLEPAALRGILIDSDKGTRLADARTFKGTITETSPVIDVALAMAKAWPDGLDAIGEVLAASKRDLDDAQLWATIRFLSSRLPEADPDAIAWAGLSRHRSGVGSATRGVVAARKAADSAARVLDLQERLF